MASKPFEGYWALKGGPPSTSQPIMNPGKVKFGTDPDKGLRENLWGFPQNGQGFHAAEPKKVKAQPKKQACGVLLYCRPTKKFLFCLRSNEVDHPNEWALFGGGVDPGETLKQAAVRELAEEGNLKIDPSTLRALYRSGDENFAYTTFLATCDTQLVPTLNWENTDYKWVSLNRWPPNLHPGVQALLDNERIQRYLASL